MVYCQTMQRDDNVTTRSADVTNRPLRATNQLSYRAFTVLLLSQAHDTRCFTLEKSFYRGEDDMAWPAARSKYRLGLR